TAKVRPGGGRTRFPARQHHADAEAVGRSASRARTIVGGAAGSRIAELPQLVDTGNLRRAVRDERGGFGQGHRLVALPWLCRAVYGARPRLYQFQWHGQPGARSTAYGNPPLPGGRRNSLRELDGPVLASGHRAHGGGCPGAPRLSPKGAAEASPA